MARPLGVGAIGVGRQGVDLAVAAAAAADVADEGPRLHWRARRWRQPEAPGSVTTKDDGGAQVTAAAEVDSAAKGAQQGGVGGHTTP